MTQRDRRRGQRIPLYVPPPDAGELLDAIARVAERHRWSRNKTIVELLKRSVGVSRRASAGRARS